MKRIWKTADTDIQKRRPDLYNHTTSSTDQLQWNPFLVQEPYLAQKNASTSQRAALHKFKRKLDRPFFENSSKRAIPAGGFAQECLLLSVEHLAASSLPSKKYFTLEEVVRLQKDYEKNAFQKTKEIQNLRVTIQELKTALQRKNQEILSLKTSETNQPDYSHLYIN